MVPVSNDTLLRVVRRRIAEQNDELTVIGIDDFAFRRGQTYGTIVCDLDRRRPVTLLPDRALDTSRRWLAEHPSISIVARDQGLRYGEAIAKALPNAEQVADRWHLMENSSRAFLDAVGKSMRQIRQAVGSNVVDPKLLTYAEKLQYEGYLRRQETNEAIREMSKNLETTAIYNLGLVDPMRPVTENWQPARPVTLNVICPLCGNDAAAISSSANPTMKALSHGSHASRRTDRQAAERRYPSQAPDGTA